MLLFLKFSVNVTVPLTLSLSKTAIAITGFFDIMYINNIYLSYYLVNNINILINKIEFNKTE